MEAQGALVSESPGQLVLVERLELLGARVLPDQLAVPDRQEVPVPVRLVRLVRLVQQASDRQARPVPWVRPELQGLPEPRQQPQHIQCQAERPTTFSRPTALS